MRRLTAGTPSEPVRLTAEVLGRKWKPVILWHLAERPHRFRDLVAHLPQAAAKVLTEELRELEFDHLIVRQVFPCRQRHVEYALSDIGAMLVPALRAMHEWGTLYRAFPADCTPPRPPARSNPSGDRKAV